MTKSTKTEVAIPEIAQAEEVISDMAKQSAPMVQRLASHRDRIDLAVKELESERFELISRRDLVRRQADAVDRGLAIHIEDIEATIRLYESGLNGGPIPGAPEQEQ